MRGCASFQLRRRRTTAVLAALLATAAPGFAQAGPAEQAQIADLRQQLEHSLQLIAALSERVQQLEAARAPGADAPAPAPNPETPAAGAEAQRLEVVEAKVAEIESASARRQADDTGLAMHGFADVGVGNHNPFDDERKGFNLGNLDFYLTPRLGDRTLTLFELVFEASESGAVNVDLERAQLGYVFGDGATAWIGRFHTPYGYTNTAMHHGAWVNDALRRPAFLQFEDHGGVLPAHTVGAWLTGALRGAQSGKVLYDVYVGNAQQIIGGELDMRSGGNDHGRMIVGGRLGYQWTDGPADGLTLGIHALGADIDDDTVQHDVTRAQIYGGYAVYDTDQWEHIAELYVFENKDLSGDTGRHHSSAGFVQLGYRAAWGVPYVRFERASLDQSDNFFRAQTTGFSYDRAAIGVRYDLDLKSALKFEAARTRVTDRALSRADEILAQYAIRF